MLERGELIEAGGDEDGAVNKPLAEAMPASISAARVRRNCASVAAAAKPSHTTV